MKMEVTEKEAQGILESRYLKALGKKPFMLFAGIIIVAFFAFIAIDYFTNGWVGFGVFCLIAFPTLWRWVRFTKRASVYARSIINEKGENI